MELSELKTVVTSLRADVDTLRARMDKIDLHLTRLVGVVNTLESELRSLSQTLQKDIDEASSTTGVVVVDKSSLATGQESGTATGLPGYIDQRNLEDDG